MRNSWLMISAWLTLGIGAANAGDCDFCDAPFTASTTRRVEPPKSVKLDFCDNDCLSKAPKVKKCYATIKVPISVESACAKCEKPQPKPAENCVAVVRKSRVVGQVPVTTYKVVREWADAPVLEAYDEKISTVERTSVPITDEIYHYVQVDGKVKKHRRDKCGTLLECEISQKISQGEFAMRERNRAGFFTGEKTVKKYRTVPGKILTFKRVPVTVMQDKIEYYEEKVPAAACVKTIDKKVSAPKIKYATKRVEVDCATKQLPIDWTTAVETSPTAPLPTPAEVAAIEIRDAQIVANDTSRSLDVTTGDSVGLKLSSTAEFIAPEKSESKESQTPAKIVEPSSTTTTIDQIIEQERAAIEQQRQHARG